jgi:hypothetical protein
MIEQGSAPVPTPEQPQASNRGAEIAQELRKIVAEVKANGDLIPDAALRRATDLEFDALVAGLLGDIDQDALLSLAESVVTDDVNGFAKWYSHIADVIEGKVAIRDIATAPSAFVGTGPVLLH